MRTKRTISPEERLSKLPEGQREGEDRQGATDDGGRCPSRGLKSGV